MLEGDVIHRGCRFESVGDIDEREVELGIPHHDAESSRYQQSGLDWIGLDWMTWPESWPPGCGA